MNHRVPLKYRNFPGPFQPYAPRVARPVELWFWVVYLALVLAVTGVMMDWPLLSYIAISGGIAVSVWLLRRWRGRLRRHDWLLCTWCGYPLGGGEPQGQCPECGRPYTHASTRWGWKVLCGEWSEEMDPPPPLPRRE